MYKYIACELVDKNILLLIRNIVCNAHLMCFLRRLATDYARDLSACTHCCPKCEIYYILAGIYSI